jgi:hypothetical protein
MVMVYRAAAIVLFLATFIAVSHNTQILKYLDEKPSESTTQATPKPPIAEQDRIREVPK